MSLKRGTTSTPKFFVLPDNVSPDSRIATFSNPRTSAPSRYFFCPENGIYEFTKIAAPKAAPRSILLARSPGTITKRNRDEPITTSTHPAAGDEHPKGEHKVDDSHSDISKGYISQVAELFVATPMDPLFFALPALAPVPTSMKADPQKQLFRSMEDHLDDLISSSTHFANMIRSPACCKLFQARMSAVCDVVEAGDEIMYRLSEEKLLTELVGKAKAMVAGGLPATLEETFVTRPLEVPMTVTTCEERAVSKDALETDEQLSIPELDTITTSTSSATESTDSGSTPSCTDTQPSSIASQGSTMTSISKPDTSPHSTITTTSAPERIIHLLRLRTALTYLTTNYLPPHLSTLLTTLLGSPTTSPVNFTELDQHLSLLSSLRQEALASSSLLDYSRKRSLDDDDEEDDARAEKKRKKEEEEKRKKAGQSRGVRDLKKVDTTGMKKLSAFFGGGGGAATTISREEK